jgi:hypothetical protein
MMFVGTYKKLKFLQNTEKFSEFFVGGIKPKAQSYQS